MSKHSDKSIRKLQVNVSTSYFTTIPRDLIEKLGWEKGDYLRIIIDGNNLIIKKVHDRLTFPERNDE